MKKISVKGGESLLKSWTISRRLISNIWDEEIL